MTGVKKRIVGHAKPPTPRAVNAAHLLTQLDALQAPISVAVVELRWLGLGALADSLSAEVLKRREAGRM